MISSKISGLWKFVSSSPSEKSSDVDVLGQNFSLGGLFGIEQLKLLWKKPSHLEDEGLEFGALLTVQDKSGIYNVIAKFALRGDTITFLRNSDANAFLLEEAADPLTHFVNPFDSISSGLYGISSSKISLFALNEVQKFELQNSSEFPEPINVVHVKHTSTKILVCTPEHLYVIHLPSLSIEKKRLPVLGFELVYTEKRIYLYDTSSLVSIEETPIRVQVGSGNITQSTN